MAVIHSFYLAPEAWREPYTLIGDEARHLSRVLRIKKGMIVRLFDGAGRFGMFRVAEVHKGAVFLDAEGSCEIAQLSNTRCTLAAGFSKGLRRGWFLEKAVELEASAVWFWQADYSQAKLPYLEKQTWQASLISGAKQCENPWLPDLKTLPGGVEEIVQKKTDFTHVFVLYEGNTKGRILTKEDVSEAGDILLIIGPEGGFSERETKLLQQAGIPHVSLGASILRWETAAVLALGLAWWARQV